MQLRDEIADVSTQRRNLPFLVPSIRQTLEVSCFPAHTCYITALKTIMQIHAKEYVLSLALVYKLHP